MKSLKKLLPYVLFFTFIMIVLYAQEALKVNSAGNVVIGPVVNPTEKLEVAGRIKDATGFVTPVGTIVAFGGATAPAGWKLCDGATVSRTGTYADLFAAIGTNFGIGNGSTTFVLPDLRGIFPKGAGRTTRAYPLGTDENHNPYEAELGTYYKDHFQGHYHRVYKNQGGDALSGGGAQFSQSEAWAVSNTPNVQQWVKESITDGTRGDPRIGLTTEPQSLGVNYIIKY
jgi:microcystin-dependent protein